MCFLREKVSNEAKDPEKVHRCDCYQSTHSKQNTIDYIHDSLLVHHTLDNTEMSWLAREGTVAPYRILIYYY